MLALLTSCGRPDLLQQTLESFYKNNPFQIEMVIHEDAKEEMVINARLANYYRTSLRRTYGAGQHTSIELFIKTWKGAKYYIHLEDDWEFNNSYDWISESIAIMEGDDKVIKVLAREGSPHPCDHNMVRVKAGCRIPDKIEQVGEKYGYLQPWVGEDMITWSGFSWNPGVTRLDLLQQFVPFPQWEQTLAANIYDAGYKVVELAKPVYKHIGDGRSTH